jgi:hypothetical protein
MQSIGQALSLATQAARQMRAAGIEPTPAAIAVWLATPANRRAQNLDTESR